MSENQIERLARIESVDHETAERALNKTEDDFETARSHIQESPLAIKYRFTNQNRDIYGIGYLIVSLEPPELNEIITLAGNDQSLENISLDASYEDLNREIEKYKSSNTTMSGLSQRLTDTLETRFSPPGEEVLALLTARNEVDFQNKLKEIISNEVNEGDLDVNVNLTPGLIGVDSDQETSDSGESDSDSESDESDTENLLCDVRVSPLKGIPVNELERGEEIFVTFKEVPDQYEILVQVLDRLRNDVTDMIPAEIAGFNHTSTGKVEIILQFGENVYGRTVIDEDMSILTPESIHGQQKGFENVIWVAGGFGLLTLLIGILYVLIFAPV